MRSHFFRCLVISTFASIISLSSFAVAPKISIDFPVEKFQLPNGLTVLMHANPNVPMVAYHTWFRVGSKDEPKGQSGIAHMLEHMMFKGSKKYSNKEFDRILHENGIINNAFTSDDYTGYYEILPSTRLDLIMDVESDRIQYLSLKPEDLQSEREVVKEEKRMRYDNDPGGLVWQKLMSTIFPTSVYGVPTIGIDEDIQDYTSDKLRSFFSQWYNPGNAILVIVGDIDLKKTRSAIEKYYGGIPGHKVVDTPAIIEKLQEKSRKATAKFPVAAPEIMFGYRAPKVGTDDAYALDLLSQILGHGKSSRLYKKIMYNDQSCVGVSSGNYSLLNDGVFFINASLKPGKNVDHVISALKTEVEKLWKQEIPDHELQKAKNQFLSEYVSSLETNDGKARALATSEVLFGDYKLFFRDLDRYNKVTVADLKRAAQTYLQPDKMTLVTLDGK